MEKKMIITIGLLSDGRQVVAINDAEIVFCYYTNKKIEVYDYRTKDPGEKE